LTNICSGSRQLNNMCLQLLQQQPLEHLAAALVAGVEEAVSATAASLQDKSRQAVWWLLDTALPRALTTETLKHPGLVHHLLAIPNFPLQLAEGLCQRGLCVSYPNLAAAATGSNRIAGAGWF
jgi:hypothetical protein